MNTIKKKSKDANKSTLELSWRSFKVKAIKQKLDSPYSPNISCGYWATLPHTQDPFIPPWSIPSKSSCPFWLAWPTATHYNYPAASCDSPVAIQAVFPFWSVSSPPHCSINGTFLDMPWQTFHGHGMKRYGGTKPHHHHHPSSKPLPGAL